MRKNNIILFLLIAGFLLSGCSSQVESQPTAHTAVVVPTDTSQPLPPTPTAAGLTAEMVRDAEYQLNAAGQPRRVKLVGGAHESGSGPDFTSARLGDLIAIGDLNRDNLQDAVAVAGENYGGSGVFTFLAVFMNQQGKPFHQFSTLIDDRPQVKGIKIEDGKIILEAVVHSADDPMCCPSMPVIRTYQLTKSGLTLVRQTSMTPTGAERSIAITSPKDGFQVSGSVQANGSVTIAPFENNLVYSIIDASGNELASGPITVNAETLGGPGTFDKAIDLSAIPPGSIIRILVSDLSAADGSTLAMDSVEVLVQ